MTEKYNVIWDFCDWQGAFRICKSCGKKVRE